MIAKIFDTIKPHYIKSLDFLKHVRTYPCCIGKGCDYRLEVSHTKNPGKGLKDDGNAVMMCTLHHREFHTGAKTFENHYPGRIEAQRREIITAWVETLTEPENEAERAYFEKILEKEFPDA